MDSLKLYRRIWKDLEAVVKAASIYCLDTGNEFGLGKCASVALQKGEVVDFNGIKCQTTS